MMVEEFGDVLGVLIEDSGAEHRPLQNAEVQCRLFGLDVSGTNTLTPVA